LCVFNSYYLLPNYFSSEQVGSALWGNERAEVLLFWHVQEFVAKSVIFLFFIVNVCVCTR